MSNQEKLYPLFLDRNKLNSIQIQLDNNSTIDSIIYKYRDQLLNRINSLYNIKSLDECCFLIIETKTNIRKEDIRSLVELKVNKKTQIYNILQNPQNNLYFVPKKKSNIEDRRKARECNSMIDNFFEDAETDYFLIKPSEEYLSKIAIYVYDCEKKTFTKEKGSVDKNQITIFKNGVKDPTEIPVKSIINDLYYTEIPKTPNKKKLPIVGDKPKFYIELQTTKGIYYFGQTKEALFTQWENAIKLVIMKYKFFNIEFNLDIKINSSKTGLYAILHSIMDNCFLVNKLLFNEEKRKMFLSCFQDKKISAIINSIILYKDSIKKDNYLETWMRFKEVITYIDSYHADNNDQKENKNIILTDENQIHKILTLDKIKKYKEISEAADESVKKIKIEDYSFALFQNEMKNALNKIMKQDLFDDIFIDIYKIYILPYFNDVKKQLEDSCIPTEKPILRQKFQFLIAIYFNQICNMNPNNFDHLLTKLNAENDLNKIDTLSNSIS